MIILVVPIIGGLLALGILLTLFGYLCHKRAKSKEKTAELTARMTGFDETEVCQKTFSICGYTICIESLVLLYMS